MTVTFQQTPGSSSDRATEWLRLLIERARTAQRAMTEPDQKWPRERELRRSVAWDRQMIQASLRIDRAIRRTAV